jgi:hypothetical protein
MLFSTLYKITVLHSFQDPILSVASSSLACYVVFTEGKKLKAAWLVVFHAKFLENQSAGSQV